VFQQHQQHLEWLRMQLDTRTLSAKLSVGGIRFKDSEAIAPAWLRVRHIVPHSILPRARSKPVRLCTNHGKRLILNILARRETFIHICDFMHCVRMPPGRMVLFMTHRPNPNSHFASVLCGCLTLLSGSAVPLRAGSEPAPAAVAAYHSYCETVESRLALQHRTQNGFLAPSPSDPQTELRLRRGEFVVEKLTPVGGAAFPGAMLHHWRGTAFAPGANAADFERLMRNFSAYPQLYAPQVLQAKVLTQQGDRLQVRMRVRQRHILTVVMDTTYEITFARLDSHRGYSISRSTLISEIDAPGSNRERALSASEEHGFLWRMNTYWSYEERDSGLYMQIESVSLTRSIPTGLGWAIGPFVESVPRESLEFTLRTTCDALRKSLGDGSHN
jgi:hypothetical protein